MSSFSNEIRWNIFCHIINKLHQSQLDASSVDKHYSFYFIYHPFQMHLYTHVYLHATACWLVAVIRSLQWRHNEPDGVSNHQPHDCLLDFLFSRRSKKATKLRVTDLCAGNSQVIGEFPAQRASNAANVSIWWRHYVFHVCLSKFWTLYVNEISKNLLYRYNSLFMI